MAGRPAKDTAIYAVGIFEDGTPITVERDGDSIGLLMVRRVDCRMFVLRNGELEPLSAIDQFRYIALNRETV